MKAMILAAGFGTRLQPFTNSFPKPSAPVNGIPIIFYNLAFLKSKRITDIVINLHHNGEKLAKLLGNGEDLGLKIRYSREEEILGTGGGIAKALRYLSDDFLVMNGDILVDCDGESWKAFVKSRAKDDLATLALYKHPQMKKFGEIAYRGKKLTSLLGVPQSGQKSQKAMFSGIHVLNKDIFKVFLPLFLTSFCVVRNVYWPYLKEGGELSCHLWKGLWTVNDRPEDILETERKLNRRRKPLSYEKILKKMVKTAPKKAIYHQILEAF